MWRLGWGAIGRGEREMMCQLEGSGTRDWKERVVAEGEERVGVHDPKQMKRMWLWGGIFRDWRS